MKEIYFVIRDNLSNLFSIIGIILTVYFAIFYVPNYVEEIEFKKIQSTHESLVKSIQELVYNGHTIDSEDIKTLIRGKELADTVKYPFTSEELLIQVQNRFMENKFIPLEQRKDLIEKIDTVRSSLPTLSLLEDVKESKFSSVTIASIISILVGILAGILGGISIWVKNKAFRELKIESTIEDRQEIIRHKVERSILMEKNIYDQLKINLGDDHIEYCPPSTPVDFIIKKESGREIGVEVKYTEMGIVPVRVIDHLISASLELQIPVVLLSNAPPTANANKRLINFNNEHENLFIRYINITESEDLASDVTSIFG